MRPAVIIRPKQVKIGHMKENSAQECWHWTIVCGKFSLFLEPHKRTFHKVFPYLLESLPKESALWGQTGHVTIFQNANQARLGHQES